MFCRRMENAIDKRFESQGTAFVTSQKAAIKLLASQNELGIRIELQPKIKNARHTCDYIVRMPEHAGE